MVSKTVLYISIFLLAVIVAIIIFSSDNSLSPDISDIGVLEPIYVDCIPIEEFPENNINLGSENMGSDIELLGESSGEGGGTGDVTRAGEDGRICVEVARDPDAPTGVWETRYFPAIPDFSIVPGTDAGGGCGVVSTWASKTFNLNHQWPQGSSLQEQLQEVSDGIKMTARGGGNVFNIIDYYKECGFQNSGLKRFSGTSSQISNIQQLLANGCDVSVYWGYTDEATHIEAVVSANGAAGTFKTYTWNRVTTHSGVGGAHMDHPVDPDQSIIIWACP